MSYIPIYLDDIFSVINVLKSKGFFVSIIGSNQSLIIKSMKLPKNQVGLGGSNENSDLVYNIFNSVELRNELKDYIVGKVEKPLLKEVIELIGNKDFFNDRQAYSTTFEWYVGEMMVKDYAALSSSFGVEISNLYRNSKNKAGDFDVISILRNMGIAYFECKTGKFNKSKILKCVERSVALHCEFSIMFVDSSFTESSLIQRLKGVSYPIKSQNTVRKFSMVGSTDFVYSWINCYFIDSSKDISIQLNIVLRVNDAKKIMLHYTTDCSASEYEELGLKEQVLIENKC